MSDRSPQDVFVPHARRDVNLIIVDRNPIFLAGALHTFGIRGYQVSGCFCSVSELDKHREFVTSLVNVVLLAGPQLQITECFDTCHWIRKYSVSIKTIFISRHAEDRTVVADASMLGVNAFLPVETDLDKLCSIIDLVQANQTVLPQVFGIQADPLTECELRVLRGISRGKSSKQVAADLNISIHTVRNEIQSALFKLQVHNRRDAVRRARHLGWI